MKDLLVLLIICSLITSLSAQDDFFAFVDKESGRPAKEDPSAYKYEVAKDVFDDLVAGQGDFRRQAPTFVMKDSEMFVAWARPESAEIGLEELAYDICASFGADSLNALAALLAHELMHYYEKHEWSRHFVKQNQGLTTAQRMEQIKEGLKLEAQADHLGGFLAYSVGYDVYGIMPQLLEKIYAETGYDLPNDIPGYPSLEDRVAMSESAMEHLKDLQVVLETANYLQVLGINETADQYYRFILRDFQSRDIYNNAGTNLLMSALDFFTEKEMPFALPIELDPESRLTRPRTRDPERERIRQREAIIGRAIDYFDRALLLDENYHPAYLNKAVSYALIYDWEEAEYQLRKLMKNQPESKIESDIWVSRGLIAALRQNYEEARAIWRKEAEQNNNPLAELNLFILQNGKVASKSEIAMGFARKQEQIESVALDQFLMETAPDRMVSIDNKTSCGYHERDNYQIYSHSVDQGREFFSIQLVGKHYTGKSMEGLQIGDDRSVLVDLYGAADRMVATPKGTFLLYPQRRMVFALDEQGRIAGWGVYRQK